jgi:hypothetical protein
MKSVEAKMEAELRDVRLTRSFIGAHYLPIAGSEARSGAANAPKLQG